MQVPEAEDPDPEKAARFKRQGDEAFVRKDFEGAQRAYSQSIQHGTGDPLVWANRSAACLRLQDYQSAYHDARISRVLHPTYVKAGPRHEPCVLLMPHHNVHDIWSVAGGAVLGLGLLMKLSTIQSLKLSVLPMMYHEHDGPTCMRNC